MLVIAQQPAKDHPHPIPACRGQLPLGTAQRRQIDMRHTAPRRRGTRDRKARALRPDGAPTPPARLRRRPGRLPPGGTAEGAVPAPSGMALDRIQPFPCLVEVDSAVACRGRLCGRLRGWALGG
ncbi:hypothetical protein GCM10010515_72130 [Streptomyces fructofermentans]|uniref:Uncharacterized protein n=1 Tax=Streptomyces fructofermentans TaxID=152141 RepID=A0A918NTH6_9ACTN|nr:hypothetical protein GCM10010515_72130 [Streptomyces fructofermentans]